MPSPSPELSRPLDDPGADWSKAVVTTLNRGPIEFTGEQALEWFKLIQDIENNLKQR
jgi:hypothetical protein